MKIRWILLGVFLIWLPLSAWAQAGRTIRGAVVQGTAGGGSTAGLEVVLRFLDGDQTPQQTTTDAEGHFVFTELPASEDVSYLLQVTYAGVVYSSGAISFAAGQDEAAIELTVYETTDDEDTISVQRAHIFVTPDDASLLVTELYVLANAGDRTYVGRESVQGRPWTSRFSLPALSRDLALEDGVLGGRFLPLEEGFVDTEPCWPGTTSVLFSYRLDCPGGSCDLSRTVWQPITGLNVLVPDVGASLAGDLAFAGRREAEGASYMNYTVEALQAGERLEVRLALPGTASASSVSPAAGPALPWIILITVLALVPLVYPFWRQRIQSSARPGR